MNDPKTPSANYPMDFFLKPAHPTQILSETEMVEEDRDRLTRMLGYIQLLHNRAWTVQLSEDLIRRIQTLEEHLDTLEP